MNKFVEGEQTLIGLFLPKRQREMKKIFRAWRVVMSEETKIINPEDLVRIEFSFGSHKKLEVYRDLARAVNEGWLKISMIDLARHLAVYTNLADNVKLGTRHLAVYTNLADNVKLGTRIDTIYHFIKEYKKKFTSNRRLYGSVTVTTSKRHLPSTSFIGEGGGDDPVVRVA